MQGFDLMHQIWRMRHAKTMPDAEVDLILRTLVDSVQTYEQVVEVCSRCIFLTSLLFPPHSSYRSYHHMLVA